MLLEYTGMSISYIRSIAHTNKQALAVYLRKFARAAEYSTRSNMVRGSTVTGPRGQLPRRASSRQRAGATPLDSLRVGAFELRLDSVTARRWTDLAEELIGQVVNGHPPRPPCGQKTGGEVRYTLKMWQTRLPSLSSACLPTSRPTPRRASQSRVEASKQRAVLCSQLPCSQPSLRSLGACMTELPGVVE